MRRIARVAALALTIVAAAGCRPTGPTAVGTRSPAAAVTSASRTRTYVSQGVKVAVTQLSANETTVTVSGLRFTVPAGWTGNVTVPLDASQTVGGWQTRPGASQEINLSGAMGRSRLLGAITIVSSRDPKSQAPPERSPRGEMSFRQVFSSPEVRLFAGDIGFPAGAHWFVARTAVPGAQFGTIVFAGVDRDARRSALELWQLLNLHGVSLPSTP